MDLLPPDLVNRLVHDALAEDLGPGDATTLSTIPPETNAVAYMRARQRIVVAGLQLAEASFRKLSPSVSIRWHSRDGKSEPAGSDLLEIRGPARALLSAERTALNFVQRLSGIATLTAAYVGEVMDTRVQILDTRKTTPGWRLLEKYAVKCGGGVNHRMGLHDLVMIKDNHLAALRDAQPNPIAAAVSRARAAHPHLRVEVEADTLEQVRQAIEAQADIILLDNMTPQELREAVKLSKGRCETEASGGVTLSNIRALAETGVDYISVGALTHSARSVDIALDFQE
ncbi:MAG TPA: carboxylating nicotinate-nucleotide diphosphorylase [Verrucomicrobiales bacterium]|nr:carboxylating nicotinate-nucleotide diphosphorylase [Verrucomicrobiales bacterium]